MARMRNPLAGGNYTTPLGHAFSNAFQLAASLPSPLERANMEATLRYRDAMARKAEQDMSDAQVKQSAAGDLGQLFSRAYGPLREQARPDPEVAGPMPAMSRDEQVREAMPDMVSAATRAGVNNLGQLFRTFVANAPETTDATVSRAMLGAGDSQASTPVGFQADQNLKREVENNRTERQANAHIAAADRSAAAQQAIANRTLVPVQVNGQWVYKPSSEAAGMAAPMPASERPQNQTPRNYILPNGQRGVTMDGLTDAMTKQPLTQGAQIFSGQVQTDNASGLTAQQRGNAVAQGGKLSQFQSTLGELRALGDNPANFGAAGNLRSFAQNVQENIAGLSAAFGQPPEAIQTLLQRATGGAPGFDPTLPQLSLMADLAAYRAAEALAEQSGRGLSNEDVKRFRLILGDPRSLLANKADFYARLDQLNKEVEREMAANQQLLQPRGGAPGTIPVSPAPGAPAPQVRPRRIDINGNDL